MQRSQAISFLSELRKKVEGGLLSKDEAEKLAVLALQEVEEAPQSQPKAQPKPKAEEKPEAQETAEPVDPKSRILSALTKFEQALSVSFRHFQEEVTGLLKETSGAAVPLGEFSIGAEELDAKVSIAQMDANSVVCTYSFKQDWEVKELDLPAPVTAMAEDACHVGLRRELLAVAEDVLDHAASAVAWSHYEVPRDKIEKISENAAACRDLRVVEATAKIAPSDASKSWEKWALSTVIQLLGSDYVKSEKKTFESLP